VCWGSRPADPLTAPVAPRPPSHPGDCRLDQVHPRGAADHSASPSHVHWILHAAPTPLRFFSINQVLAKNDRMARDGEQLIRQLVDNPAYLANSEEAVPAAFRVPNEPAHPMFVQVDFGLIRNPSGELQPKRVELQAFPSLYAYQGPLARAYINVYGLEAASGFRLPASGSE